MATFRKRGNKWQVQVRRKGEQQQSRTFISKADAQAWGRLIELKIDRRDLAPNLAALDSTTLGDVLQRYLAEVVPAKKGAKVEAIVLKAFLRQELCGKPLSQLTTADFATYRDERLLRVSPATFKRQLAPIKSALRIARDEWGLPSRDILFAGLRVHASDNRRERRFRLGEFERLELAAEKTRNPLVWQIVLFALETAMRRGELLSMRWEHVDYARRSVAIPDAKNGHSRAVPLTEKALTILGRMSTEGDVVFPVTALALRLSWVRITRRASIDNLHFHDLRHEAISRLFEKGLTVPEVAAISGHRDIRMLMRYAHADMRLVIRKLDRTIC